MMIAHLKVKHFKIKFQAQLTNAINFNMSIVNFNINLLEY